MTAKSRILHRSANQSALGALALFLTAQSAAAGDFASSIDLSSIAAPTGMVIRGAADEGFFGRSLAPAGDINGDGLADIVAGVPQAPTPASNNAGSAYVVFGTSTLPVAPFDVTALNGSNGFRIDGKGDLAKTGTGVASAGHLNGDAYADIAIGAPLATFGTSTVGGAHVIFGKASGFAPVLNVSALNGKNGFNLKGIDGNDALGYSAAPAGDINGDGRDDMVVGTFEQTGMGGFKAGHAYVVFGKAGGFASTLPISALNGSNGFKLNGVAVGDAAGRSVAGGGDFNGDGIDDLLIGANNAAPGGHAYAGSAFVVFGKKTAFASSIDLSGLDGSTGFRIDFPAAMGQLGFATAMGGDMNGDGMDDIAISAWTASTVPSASEGAVFVVFGSSAAHPAVISTSGLDGANGFAITGPTPLSSFGAAVAFTGDINGDGFADLVAGAPGLDEAPGNDTGAAYVIFGKASPFSAAMALSSLSGDNGFRLLGEDFSKSGWQSASAGDFNGDGFDDLLIGAYRGYAGAVDQNGAAYVVLGRAPQLASTRTGSAASQYMSGGAQADTLSGLDGDDVLEGRGDADALDGGDGNDTASYAHAGGPVIADLGNPASNAGDAAGDTYTSVENLTGSAFNDTLTGDANANRMTGGKGLDIMNGGGGPDTFVYGSIAESMKGALRDQIVGFNAGSATTAVDRIDLRAIDAKSGVPGNQAFRFIGTARFSKTKGELRIARSGAHTIVSGDVTGDGKADLEILLKNFTHTSKLTKKDFQL